MRSGITTSPIHLIESFLSSELVMLSCSTVGWMRRLVIAVIAAVLSGCAADAPGAGSTLGIRAAGCEAVDRLTTVPTRRRRGG